jgi:hypothetical protein
VLVVVLVLVMVLVVLVMVERLVLVARSHEPHTNRQ